MDNVAQSLSARTSEKTDASCSRCGGAMSVIRIEPAWGPFERRIYECRECRQSDSYTI